MTAAIQRPEKSEYAPYYETYVSLVPSDEIVGTLKKQSEQMLAFIKSIPESRGSFRYEEGKWSIKEVIGHLIDGERVFAYRALRFARHDNTPLSVFEQDDFIRGGSFDSRTLSDLAEEYEAVRRSTICLFGSLTQNAWSSFGNANNDEVSVRALAFIIAGHERHHSEVLRSRYL